MARLCSAAANDRWREASKLTELTWHISKNGAHNSVPHGANIMEDLVGVLNAEDVPEKIVREIPGPGG
jgi:hypothetical protein